MSIHIRDITPKPETVILVLKTRYPKTRKPVHCINCGGIMYYSYKRVQMIIQGVAEIEQVEDEVRCGQCKAIYEIC